MCSCFYKPGLAQPDLPSETRKHFFYLLRQNSCFGKSIFLLFFFSLFATSAFPQQKIAGVVTSPEGSALSGASVSVNGSKNGTVTKRDGSFVITANTKDVLLISYIGYDTKRITIGNETNLKIILSLSVNELDQVVVTGYTSQRIKEIAGSVASVKPKDLIAVPAGQTEQMLQGRVAGLTVISSGIPGASANIRLHGIGNFGNVTPLYIIDGIEGNINSINPYDIESLQVLKDAVAYSIYGVRGANGVIVVTTKRGKSGKTRVTYDFYVGLQQPLKKGPPILTPQENADLTWIAKRNSHDTLANGNPYDAHYGNGLNPILPDYLFAGSHVDTLYEGSPYVADSLYNFNPDNPPIYQIVRFDKTGTDWFHELYKPAWSQNHNVAISGGNEKNDYLFSFGYLDQQGTLLNTYLKRFTIRINTDFNVLNAVKIGENLQLSYADNPQPNEYVPGISGVDDENAAINGNPASPVYDIKGNWNSGYNNPNAGPQDNPVAVRTLAKNNKNKTWEVFGNVFAEINFLKYFTAKASFGGKLINFYNYNFQYASFAWPAAGAPNSLTEASGYMSSMTGNGSINYSRNFSGDHTIKVLAGVESINNYNRQQSGTAQNLTYSVPNYWVLGNGDPLTKKNYSIASISKLYSFISRLEYGFKDRYFITANLRRDGSSVFGPENRFGWFPSIGGAWRISQENFLGNVDWLTELKLRGGWGKTGFNGNTDPSNQFTLYGSAPADAFYAINGANSGSIQPGFRVIQIGNAKTGWQQDVVTNIGLDAILWNGKFSVTSDLYQKESRGLLFQIALPDLLGDATPPNINVGDIRNTGIDLTLGSKGSFSRNWGWDVLVTATHYQNKILKLNEVPYFFDFFQHIKNEVGYEMSSFYGYKITGFFQDSADVSKSPSQPDAAPGRFKYLDANGDGKISDSDRVHIGSPHPTYTLGINIGLRFKDFDFSTFLYGSFGNELLNLNRFCDMFSASGVHYKTALYDSWTPDHKNATAPVQEASYNFSNAGVNNSYGLENGSYLRNKSIIVGYTFPRKSLEKLKIDRLRIYLQVTNLFTITNYTGLDPELPDTGISPLSTEVHRSNFGIDIGNYPNNQKQFLFGLNVAF